MKFTFNILALLLSVALSAQVSDSVSIPQKNWRINDIKIGANIVRAARTFIGSGKDTQELQASLNTNKFDFVIDYGTEKNTIGGAYSYENEGTYYRVGLDRNFVKNESSGNALSLGLRYSRASFEDRLNYTSDVGFGTQEIMLSNSNLQARWLELVVNLRGKLISNLYTGFTLRWQFARNVNGEGVLQTYDIPGFGNTRRENSTAFDYYLMWRIPLRK